MRETDNYSKIENRREQQHIYYVQLVLFRTKTVKENGQIRSLSKSDITTTLLDIGPLLSKQLGEGDLKLIYLLSKWRGPSFAGVYPLVQTSVDRN